MISDIRGQPLGDLLIFYLFSRNEKSGYSICPPCYLFFYVWVTFTVPYHIGHFLPKHSNYGFLLDKIVYEDCFDEKKIGMIIAIIIGVVLVLENIFLVVCWCYMKRRPSKNNSKTTVEFQNKNFGNVKT